MTRPTKSPSTEALQRSRAVSSTVSRSRSSSRGTSRMRASSAVPVSSSAPASKVKITVSNASPSVASRCLSVITPMIAPGTEPSAIWVESAMSTVPALSWRTAPTDFSTAE